MKIFNWFKKKEIDRILPPVPRSWDIPENYIKMVLSLYDESNKTNSCLSKYNLWEGIFSLIPELKKETYGTRLRVDVSCILKPQIIEIIKED